MKIKTAKTSICLPSKEELVELPPHLDGGQGTNRGGNLGQGKLVSANNDIAAIDEWISATATSPHTIRSYRLAAYRLVLWAVYFRRKPVSSLMVNDLKEFANWLSNPVRHPNWPTEWRIINGPLSAESRTQSMTILQGMFAWLVAAQYLAGNPFVLMNFRKVQERVKTNSKESPTKFFQPELWDWIEWFIDYLPSVKWPTDENGHFLLFDNGLDRKGNAKLWSPEKWDTARHERIRFITLFLYGSCARRAELANGKMSQVQKEDDVWVWSILGKGQKKAKVILDSETMAVLKRYRSFRGLVPVPQYGESKVPIVAKLYCEEPVTDWMLYHEIKSFFKHAEMFLRFIEPSHEEWLGKLAYGSTHWMRHTWASHAAATGVPIRATADQLRHSSTATTERVYVHATLKQRKEDISAVRKKLINHLKK